MVHHHIIILAAGEGTRMKSSIPKVLHPVAGWPMLRHVIHTAIQLEDAHIALVVGAGAELVQHTVQKFAPHTQYYTQTERLGTAHAVLAARAALEAQQNGVVLILFGDTPLMRAETLQKLSDAVLAGAAVAVLAFETNAPHGYGRVVVENGHVEAIVEEKDATDTQRTITLCNAGAMAVDASMILNLLNKIDNHNTKHEFYLTDIVRHARAAGHHVAYVQGAFEEALGANTRVELAQLESLFQHRTRTHMMLSGVSMPAPETVYFSADTHIAQDVTIAHHVVFGLGVTVETGANIHAFSHLEGAHVGAHANVGPYARLRPGTILEPNTRVGNFVEIKNTHMMEGAKANHLSYIGDAHVGAHANIGAGTITCNYDGFNKFNTHIGAGAFIGSNSALVAPVTIGDGAIIGAGSTITHNVPENAIALTRAALLEKNNAANVFRDKRKIKQ